MKRAPYAYPGSLVLIICYLTQMFDAVANDTAAVDLDTCVTMTLEIEVLQMTQLLMGRAGTKKIKVRPRPAERLPRPARCRLPRAARRPTVHTHRARVQTVQFPRGGLGAARRARLSLCLLLPPAPLPAFFFFF